MNHSELKQNFSLKSFLVAVIFTLSMLALLFVLLSYLMFKLPNFENFYSFFPIALLGAEGLFIVFISRRFPDKILLMTFILSAIVSVLSLLFGLFFKLSLGDLPRLIAIHLIFVAGTVLLQIFVMKRSPAKKRKKKMPFEK